MSWLRRGTAGIACAALVALAGGSAAVRAEGPATTASGAPSAAAKAGAPAPEPPSPPPPVLAAPLDGPAQTAGGVAGMLAGALADRRLGGRVAATVVDAETGAVLLDRSAGAYVPPASAAKLVTAVAVLAGTEPDRRLTTTLVAGERSGEVVLVGGGDATLSGATGGAPTTYEGAPRLATLAAAARRAGVRTVNRVVVDGSLLTGPRLAPGWNPVDIAGGYVAPVTALMLDGGRQGPGVRARSMQPDLAAGRALAAMLGAPGVPVVRGTAPTGGRVLGTVQSQPLSRLVEQMLLASDNVLAELLARQVAIAEGRPASFAGGAEASRAVLTRLGLPEGGDRLVDGSGLSLVDRATPALLAALLQAAAAADRPELHALLAGLPVAGYDGTLDDRFRGPAAAAAGQVRAKTGTLTGVSALAGLVRGSGGRLLVFAVVADRVPPAGTLGAEAALDAIAARLARCGCP